MLVGLLPFLPGDVVKAVAAALALPTAWRFLNRRGGAGV
jgi:biotin transport system substrate-specific component